MFWNFKFNFNKIKNSTKNTLLNSTYFIEQTKFQYLIVMHISKEIIFIIKAQKVWPFLFCFGYARTTDKNNNIDYIQKKNKHSICDLIASICTEYNTLQFLEADSIQVHHIFVFVFIGWFVVVFVVSVMYVSRFRLFQHINNLDIRRWIVLREWGEQ